MDNFRDSYFNVTWDLTKKHLRGTFWGKQYDTGRGFAVTIVEGGQVTAPSTETVRLKWEKPDSTEGYVTAVVVGDKFLIEDIDQMFTVHGAVRSDLEIWRGGKVISSITFYVSVEKAVAVDAIESSSDFTALQEALADVDDVQAQVDAVIANATVDSEVILARGTETTLGARLDASENRIDTIITTPVPTGEIIAQEIIDARQGEVSVGANITEVKTSLAQTEQQIGSDVRFKDYNNAPIITFITDDGNKADYDIFKPLFDTAGVPFVTSIVTNFVGTGNYCTLEQLKEIRDAGHEVCSHTHTHQMLKELTDEELDNELKLSQEWLKNHGFSYKTFCIPYNNFDERVLKHIAKYYDCSRKSGAGEGTGYNTNPVATYRLHSDFLGSTTTLEEYQTKIDNAVAGNGWLIISTHSWEIRDWGNAEILRQIVEYAKTKAEVVTLSEGIKRRKNLVNAGVEYSDESLFKYKEHFYLSSNGKVSSNRINSKFIAPNTVNGNTSIDDFEDRTLSICYITSNREGLPVSQSGYLYTYKFMWLDNTPNGTFYQIFKPYNSVQQYIRQCSNTKTWGEWKRQLLDDDERMFFDNSKNGLNVLSEYKNGITITELPNANATDMPKAIGGLLTTYKTSTSNAYVYSYQTYAPRGENTLFMRKSATNSTWNGWILVNGNLSLSANARQNLPVQGLSVGMSVFDTTLGKPVWLKSIEPREWVYADGLVVPLV